jgi:protein phosphatase
LSDVVPAKRIEQRLRDIADRTEVADTLIDDALAGGAPDNVTVVVVDVERLTDTQDDETEPDLGPPTQPLPTS